MTDKEFLNELGIIFKVARTRQRLNTTVAAERAKISREQLSRIESGKCAPNMLTLKKIADGLGTPLREILINLPNE